jgi:hypothetical protein
MRHCLLVVALGALTTGCATTYHTQSLTGGFTETRLDENVFQVRFAGNGYTSRERAADFCLLRCCELAQQYGYAYLIVVDSAHYTKDSAYTTPTTATTTGSAQTNAKATVTGEDLATGAAANGSTASYIRCRSYILNFQSLPLALGGAMTEPGPRWARE